VPCVAVVRAPVGCAVGAALVRMAAGNSV